MISKQLSDANSAELLNSLPLFGSSIPQEANDTLKDDRFFFIGELLIAAGLFYAGYKIGTPLESIANSLKSLDNTVKAVAARVNEIADKVDAILDEIKHLVTEIQGIVDKAFLTNALAEQRGVVNNLNFYVQDETTFRNNLVQVKALVDQLSTVAYKVRAFSDDEVAFLVFAAPAMALWAHTKSMILRTDCDPQTIWDHPFHADSMQAVLSIIDQFNSAKAGYLAEIAGMPQDTKVYELQGGRFVESSVPFNWVYKKGDAHANLFAVVRNNPDPPASPIVTLYSTSNVWFEVPPHGDEFYFQQADAGSIWWQDPPHVAAASSVFAPIAARYSKLTSTLRFFEHADDVRQGISDNCATKPTDWITFHYPHCP